MGNIENAEISRQKSSNKGFETGIAMSPLVRQSLVDEAASNDRDMTFSNIAGVLPNSEKSNFERMLFRATRGNCYVRFEEIKPKIDESSELTLKGPSIDKTVFIIFYKSQAIEGKIKRICDSFNCRRFDLTDLDRPHLLLEKQESNHKDIREAKQVLDKNTETRRAICEEVAKQIELWLWTARREKAIYHTMNLFNSDISNVLRGRAWVLKNKVGKVKAAIARAHATLNLTSSAMFERVPDAWPAYPTHFTTNKYTDAFQEFVNTYGIPRYREINPALFTAATFPFLFGVMYGDIGHGTCLTLMGYYLIVTEHKAEARGTDEMMRGVYSGRYLILIAHNFYFSV
jgi:V-type H+-transporting ATPase subunit a